MRHRCCWIRGCSASATGFSGEPSFVFLCLSCASSLNIHLIHCSCTCRYYSLDGSDASSSKPQAADWAYVPV